MRNPSFSFIRSVLSTTGFVVGILGLCWSASLFLDKTEQVQAYSSVLVSGSATSPHMVRGSDGYPRLVFAGTSGTIKYVRCSDEACTNTTPLTVDTNPGDLVPVRPMIAMGNDGFARITYTTNNGAFQRLIRCNNNDCTAPTITSNVLQGAGGAMISIGADGLPRFAYGTASGTFFSKCTTADCASLVTHQISAVTTSTGFQVTLDDSDIPHIFFTQQISPTDAAILYVHCNDVDCSNATASVVKTSAATNDTYSSSQKSIIGNDTYARLVYLDLSTNELSLLICTNASCTTSTAQLLYTYTAGTAMENLTSMLPSVSLLLTSTDMPRIIHYTTADKTWNYVYCTATDCTSRTSGVLDTTNTVLSQNVLGSALYLSAVGFPIVTISTSDGVVVNKCTDNACLVSSPNNVPTEPTSLYTNIASDGAQSGISNPSALVSTNIVFSAIYHDPDPFDVANKYRIQISSDAAFNSTSFDTGAQGTSIAGISTGARSSSIAPTGFTPALETTYYWRIKFWDTTGEEGPFSTETATFKIRDTATPILGAAEPTSGQTGVSPSTDIVFSITDQGSGVSSSSLIVNIQGVDAIVGGQCQTGYSCILTPISNGIQITINPTADLAVGIPIDIQYSISDMAQIPNTLSSSYNFTTAPVPFAASVLYANVSTVGAQAGLSSPSTLDGTDIVFSAIHTDPSALTATKYRLQVATDNNFSNIIYDSGQGGTTLSSPIPHNQRSETIAAPSLTDNTTYYWRIQFWNSAGAGPFSPSGTNAANFHTHINQVPSAPSSLYVNTQALGAQSGRGDNPDRLTSTQVVFSAQHNDIENDAAAKYELQIALANDFNNGSIVYDSGNNGTDLALPLSSGARSTDISIPGGILQEDTIYYWRIRFWDLQGVVGNFSASAAGAASFRVHIKPTILAQKSLTNSDLNASHVQYSFVLTPTHEIVDQGMLTMTFPNEYSAFFSELTSGDIQVVGTNINSTTKTLFPQTNTLQIVFSTSAPVSTAITVDIGDGLIGGLHDLTNPSGAGIYTVGFATYDPSLAPLDQGSVQIPIGSTVLVDAHVSEALLLSLSNQEIQLQGKAFAAGGHDASQYTVLTVQTNNSAGYGIYGQLRDGLGNAGLTNVTATSTIPTGTGGNSFGFKAKNTPYNQAENVTAEHAFQHDLSVLHTDVGPVGLDTPTNTQEHTIYYDLQVDYAVSPGVYTGEVTYTVVASF